MSVHTPKPSRPTPADHLEHLKPSLKSLADALDFLDRARQQSTYHEAGTLRDAHEWVEKAARETIEAAAEARQLA